MKNLSSAGGPRGRGVLGGTDGRLAFYMADDWEFEHVYKFVTARA